MVGSVNQYATEYISVAAAQSATVELIQDVEAMVEVLLKRFEAANGFPPKRIIYWRDGVAESMVKDFLKTEAAGVKRALRSFGSPSLTTINVVKRHHTRFFPGNGPADKLGNVVPGTVVENDGTGKDCFLLAHRALQGTARPTRYQLLMDENGLTADPLQRLIRIGCSTYARSTTAISVVAPVYYADQMAQRSKYH